MRSGPAAEKVGGALFEGIENLAEHCTKDSRRDASQQRIAEFVINREAQIGLPFAFRLEPPMGPR